MSAPDQKPTPQARRITPEDQPRFPCWLHCPQLANVWLHYPRAPVTDKNLSEYLLFNGWTHWHPDQPEAPTVRPDDGPENLGDILEEARLPTPPSAEPGVTPDWAKRAAKKVLSNLTDRKGIDDAFDQIDEEIQEEIEQTVAAIIAKHAPQPVVDEGDWAERAGERNYSIGGSSREDIPVHPANCFNKGSPAADQSHPSVQREAGQAGELRLREALEDAIRCEKASEQDFISKGDKRMAGACRTAWNRWQAVLDATPAMSVTAPSGENREARRSREGPTLTEAHAKTAERIMTLITENLGAVPTTVEDISEMLHSHELAEAVAIEIEEHEHRHLTTPNASTTPHPAPRQAEGAQSQPWLDRFSDQAETSVSTEGTAPVSLPSATATEEQLDRKRMDWADEHLCHVTVSESGLVKMEYVTGDVQNAKSLGRTLRESIDTAMRSASPQNRATPPKGTSGTEGGDLVCVSPTTGVRTYHRRNDDGTFNSIPWKTEYPK